jgi:hypothetical protein
MNKIIRTSAAIVVGVVIGLATFAEGAALLSCVFM